MFLGMEHGWFNRANEDYNDFMKAMLQGDLDAMNAFMNDMALELFSSFDSGKKPSLRTPERIRCYGFAFEWSKILIGN